MNDGELLHFRDISDPSGFPELELAKLRGREDVIWNSPLLTVAEDWLREDYKKRDANRHPETRNMTRWDMLSENMKQYGDKVCRLKGHCRREGEPTLRPLYSSTIIGRWGNSSLWPCYYFIQYKSQSLALCLRIGELQNALPNPMYANHRVNRHVTCTSSGLLLFYFHAGSDMGVDTQLIRLVNPGTNTCWTVLNTGLYAYKSTKSSSFDHG